MSLQGSGGRRGGGGGGRNGAIALGCCALLGGVTVFQCVCISQNTRKKEDEVEAVDQQQQRQQNTETSEGIKRSWTNSLQFFWSRLCDIVRPRVWFIKTMIQLKIQLFRHHGSSRINFKVLNDFTDEYDTHSPPRLHPPTIDFINYAMKQLIGINDMFWILYMFCPLFVDEKMLFFWNRRLRSMIVKYVILPGTSRQDQGIVGMDDIYALIPKVLKHLKQFQDIGLVPRFENDMAWRTIPTIEMALKGKSSLSVSFLPLHIAILFPSGPPIFGTMPERHVRPPSNLNTEAKEEQFGGGKDHFFDMSAYEDSPIPIFISHRWAAAEQPNADNDFMELCQMLAYVIQCAIQASIVLLHAGFPLDQLILRQQRYMRRGKPLRHVLSLDFSKLGKGTSEPPEATQQISGQLQRDIFALTARVVLKDFWSRYDKRDWNDYMRCELSRQWLVSVMKKIWLWYDYTCVPQRPLRNTEHHLRIRFDLTLEHLAEIQQRAHTLTMNQSSNYAQRAWCMAEYISADSSMHNGRSEFRRSILLGHQPDHLLAYPAFELLINPMLTFPQVLERLQWQFTNEEHIVSYSSIICWILWNSILRREQFQSDFYASYHHNTQQQGQYNALLLGRGESQNVLAWITKIQEALAAHWPRELAPFWVANARTGDSLKYNLKNWTKARENAFVEAADEDGAIEVRILIVPFEHGRTHRPKYIEEALAEVKHQLLHLTDATNSCEQPMSGTTVLYEVYLQNTDETINYSNNQDLLYDYDWY